MTGSVTIAAIGWIGSALVVISLMQTNLGRLRMLSLAASLLLGGFNLALGIGPGIALNVALVMINGYHLLTEYTRDRRGTNSLTRKWRQLGAVPKVRFARSP